MPARVKPVSAQAKSQTSSGNRSPLNVGLITRDLYGWSEPTDAAAATVGLAQHFAAQGDIVTLIWVPPYNAIDEASAAKLTSFFFNHYLVKLEILTSSKQLLPALGGSEKSSTAVYYHLKEQEFDTVYFALEGGLAYYTLLAKELGLFEPRPVINVMANAPLAWQAHADRRFLEDLAQVTIAHMEKYCVEEADCVISASTYILDWMKHEGWSLQNARVMPNLRPHEWQGLKPVPGLDTTGKEISELVFFSGPEFHRGLTLFCDTLDALARKHSGPLTITLLSRFGRILGEHTAGMVLRRSRSWPFALKIMPRLAPQEVVEYLGSRHCLAVLPYYAANTPLDVATCLEEGIPFVATDAGGIAEMVDEKSRGSGICQGNPVVMAEQIAAALKTPTQLKPRIPAREQRQIWSKHLDEAAPRSLPTKAAGKNSKKPLVSIVMVHHDRPDYLLQAVDAVEQQDYPNFELILVDDGSALKESHTTLDTLEKRFKQRGWKILREKNRYLGAARNTGVRASRGDRILFVDDDNALFRNAVSVFVAAMDASGADICTAFQRMFYGSSIPTDEKLGYIQYFPLGGILELGLIHDVFGDANAMIRRSVFDRIGFQIEDYGYTAHDWEFFTRATLAGLKVRIIPESLYWYRSSSQGMYRTSHWYDNRQPIVAAFHKHGFSGLKYLHHLILSENVTDTEREGYKENLRYNVSNEPYLKLAKLDPESDEAINLLAEIAATEGRADTSLILLGRAKVANFRKRAGDSLDVRGSADKAVIEHGAEFTSESELSSSDLQQFSITASPNSELVPLSYVEGKNRLYLQAAPRSSAIAVGTMTCPAGSISVSAEVALDQANATPMEFLILMLPTSSDPATAIQRATQEKGEGTSGWCALAHSFEARTIEARFSIPSINPCNIVLAVRTKDAAGTAPSLGCFSRVTISRSLGYESVRRPRKGPPPHRLRAREWTNEERLSAALMTKYPSPLPLLLFPPYAEGLFLRPSAAGNVIATLPWAFPAFARRVVASVEIAHEEASPFEFAMALSRPGETLRWTGDKPVDGLAFSGWVTVQKHFELHKLSMNMAELVRTSLSINLAIRLPKGSKPAPANAYWRKLVFLWEE